MKSPAGLFQRILPPNCAQNVPAVPKKSKNKLTFPNFRDTKRRRIGSWLLSRCCTMFTVRTAE